MAVGAQRTHHLGGLDSCPRWKEESSVRCWSRKLAGCQRISRIIPVKRLAERRWRVQQRVQEYLLAGYEDVAGTQPTQGSEASRD